MAVPADPELERERLLVVEFFKAQKLPTDIASHFTSAGFDTLETLCTLTAESLDDIEKFNQTRWLPGHKVRLQAADEQTYSGSVCLASTQQTFADIAGRVRAFTEERDYLIRAASGYCPHPQLVSKQSLMPLQQSAFTPAFPSTTCNNGTLMQSPLTYRAQPHTTLYSPASSPPVITLSAEESDDPMACGGGAPNMNLENLDPRVGLTTRLLLTDQRATRTNTPTRKRWSYLVVTLPNSRMQIGTWTMVYDEGFEDDHADGKPQRKWGCFYAEKENPADAEETFVVSGHGYGLPNLPVPTQPLPSTQELRQLLRRVKRLRIAEAIRDPLCKALPHESDAHILVPTLCSNRFKLLVESKSVGSFVRSPKESAPNCGPEDRCPVVAAIDAPDALFLYDDGFFDSKPSDHGKLCDSPKKGFTGWEYTNHAIAIVGWGEDPTWGNTWGRNGYVKMKRGENLAAIESQAVAIDPDIQRGRAAALVKEIRGQAAVK
ncbi:hypothetical protein ACSSS7_008258 [Eimeria intestinalis]